MMVEDRPKPPVAVAGVGYLQLQQAGLARTRRAGRARRLSPPKQEQEQGAAARTRRPVSDIRERRRVRPARSRVCRLGAEQDVMRGEKKCKRGAGQPGAAAAVACAAAPKSPLQNGH